jgi:hypothetical protein
MSNLANVKKGETVVLLGFTGIRLADMVVASADKKTITLDSKKGELVFDRKTGVQTNTEEGKEKYANKIVLPEDAPEQKKRTKTDKKVVKVAEKKVEKKVKAKEVVEDDDEDEDEEEEKPAPKAKKVEKKKAVEPEDDDEDDEDDEDYEEI